MKNFCLIFLCFCVFISCNSNSKTPVKDSLVNSSSIKNQSEELMNKFKPMVQGDWVNKDYIDEIAKTKSAQRAYKKLEVLQTLRLILQKLKAIAFLLITIA